MSNKRWQRHQSAVRLIVPASGAGYSPPNVELWAKGSDHQKRLLFALRNGESEAARSIIAAHMQTAQKLMEGQEAELLQRFMSE